MDKEAQMQKLSLKGTGAAKSLFKDASEEPGESDAGDLRKDLKKSTKLDTSLKDLQKELRSEWGELHKQHEKLTHIITEFSKAKEIFEKGRNKADDGKR